MASVLEQNSESTLPRPTNLSDKNAPMLKTLCECYYDGTRPKQKTIALNILNSNLVCDSSRNDGFITYLIAP